MIIDFNKIEEVEMPCMNGGTGTMSSKFFMNDIGKIIPTRIHIGGSIGLHKQDSGDDVNYIISGMGKAICDGKEELLTAGCCHICSQGSEHSIINIGDEDLVMLTVVIHR